MVHIHSIAASSHTSHQERESDGEDDGKARYARHQGYRRALQPGR
jgi:hypothetical protein